MRFETLILYVILVIHLMIPAFCLFVKEKALRSRLINLSFYSVTSMLFIDVLLMMIYQVQNRFMFQHVYNHISVDMKLIYKISAMWASQEGSFLLWSLIMAVMGLFVIHNKADKADNITSLYSILCSVIVILTIRSNPFQLTGANMSDGLGLNKALQNPWMVVHPPLVFIGYSAMAVLLSLSAGMNSKIHTQTDIAKRTKLWVRISFLFLSMGIFTGSIWAYAALGWGGYWSWDPIENAALVPWLILCAYLHKKKRLSKLDCIIPFTLAGLGTFLTRSGILANKSVHAYAVGRDSLLTYGIFGILILFIVVIISFNILLKRKHQKQNPIGTLTFQNPIALFELTTYLFAFFVFIGNIFPLITSITIPIQYYNYLSVIFVIINIILFLILHMERLLKKFVPIMILNTLFIIFIIFAFHVISLWLILLWLTLLPVWMSLLTIQQKNMLHIITHIGLFIFFAGIIASSSLSTKISIIADSSDIYIHVDKHTISVEDLNQNGNITIVTFAKDIIVNSSDVITDDKTSTIISYTIKPLIILFWTGGVIIILCLILKMILNKKANKTHPGQTETDV